MSTISSISELLNLSNCQFRIYDIGRKVDKLSKEQFNKIELNQLPYPYPSQGYAFLAIAFWQKNSSEPYLWFIKLPLDERGLLNQGARNHFIAIIIEALGADLSIDPTEQQEELLKSNPYHFTPAQYKLASINSLLKIELKQPASQYYETCQQYFHGQVQLEHWHNVGVQGLADYACRLTEDNNTIKKNITVTNEEALSAIIQQLPIEVLQPLCSALENHSFNAPLIEKIIESFWLSYKTHDCNKATTLIRALASNSQHPYFDKLMDKLLKYNDIPEEILITLAGRNWHALHSDTRLIQFLERLVQHKENDLFFAIFKDLVAIPNLRPILLQCIRNPKRSDALTKAIGLLFSSANTH
jgi:hypothetical protein